MGKQPNNNHNSIRSTRSRTLHNNMLAANTVKGVSARRCTKSITRRRQTTTTAAKKGDVVSAAATADAPVVKGPTIIDGQVAHSTTELALEVFRDLGDFASGELTGLLKPVESSWQPQDYLPDPESDSFLDEVRELRERSQCLPDDYLVTIVGDMITEEALPTYMAMLNTLDGVSDETGASGTPWATWTRAWTAEENRHGDLLNKYLWLTGRVDMRQVEVTIQNLIGSGMDPKTENNPYLGFVYTSFQERATRVSHGNTARHAKIHGDATLARICGIIAADEARHENAYSRIVEEILKRDPNGGVVAFADMMRKQIVMPAHLMNDMKHEELNGGSNLFADFSIVAEKTETYTAFDYADIMEHLVKRWEISSVTGLNADGLEAQEYVCKLPARIRKIAEKTAVRKAKAAKANPKDLKFSWIHERTVSV